MAQEKLLVRYRLDDDTPVYIEAEGHQGNDAQRIGRGTGEAIEATERFEAAVARIKPAAECVLNVFRQMNTPEEINLEFGIKFGAKAGVILASADSEATFRVSLKWKNEA